VNVLRRIPAVFAFEWRRTQSTIRIAWWVLLASFPPLLLGLIRINLGRPPDPEPVELVVYILGPGVVCMLGVFLWAAPWLSTELEGQSWVYMAVRPHGALAVLLGKYLVAVAWTIPAALLATAVGALIMADANVLQLIWVQWRLVVLSCLAYAAVFVLIGVLFPKRAMVLGVFYAIVFEVVLASIPAAVNLLTVQYRLRCLLVRWLDWDERLGDEAPLFRAYFGDQSAAWHVSILLLQTLIYLGIAALVLRWKEYTEQAATDV
jgi:hypothetical protein